MNLGDSSFLDGIAAPGWLVEEIADGQHLGQIVNGVGVSVQGPSAVNSLGAQTHIAWLSKRRVAGGWYGMEILDEVADVDAGAQGHTSGVGNVIFAPLIREWTGHRVFKMWVVQRVVTGFAFPTSQYSQGQSVNIGTNTYEVNPYYAITFHPAKRIESSWRIHYLWNSINKAPPFARSAKSTQAGQAIHFNATVSYNMYRGLWLGANTYYFSQITDGRISGVDVSNSPERVAAIGPGVVFTTKHNFFYVSQYQEFAGENRAIGRKLVLRLMRVF